MISKQTSNQVAGSFDGLNEAITRKTEGGRGGEKRHVCTWAVMLPTAS